MRKLILISAMLLMSAAAHAGGQRSLTLVASSEEPAKSVETKPTDATAVETPKYVERPSAVDTNAAQPATQCQPSTTAEAPKTAAKEIATTEKPKRRHQSTQSRVISELHRYGIYW